MSQIVNKIVTMFCQMLFRSSLFLFFMAKLILFFVIIIIILWQSIYAEYVNRGCAMKGCVCMNRKGGVGHLRVCSIYSTNNHMSELFNQRLSLVTLVNIAAMLCTCIPTPSLHAHPPPPPPPHSLCVFCIPCVGKRQNTASASGIT